MSGWGNSFGNFGQWSYSNNQYSKKYSSLENNMWGNSKTISINDINRDLYGNYKDSHGRTISKYTDGKGRESEIHHGNKEYPYTDVVDDNGNLKSRSKKLNWK